MILQLLNRKNFNGIIYIPLFGLLIWSPTFFGEPTDSATHDSSSIFYQFLAGWIGNTPMLSPLIALLMTLVSAFVLQQFDSRYGLLQKKTALPAYLFVIIAGGFSDLHTLHPVHLAMPLFLMAIFRLFNAQILRVPLKNFFDAGFLLGIGILIYPQLMFFFPLMLMAAFILVKEPEWRLFVIPLIGIIIPPLFLISILFLGDNTQGINSLMGTNLISDSTSMAQIQSNLLIFLAFISLLLLVAGFKIGAFSEELRNLQRKYHHFFILMMINALPIIVLAGRGSTSHIWLAAAPSAMLIAILLGTFSRTKWVEIILAILFLGALLQNDMIVAIFLPQ